MRTSIPLCFGRIQRAASFESIDLSSIFLCWLYATSLGHTNPHLHKQKIADRVDVARFWIILLQNTTTLVPSSGSLHLKMRQQNGTPVLTCSAPVGAFAARICILTFCCFCNIQYAFVKRTISCTTLTRESCYPPVLPNGSLCAAICTPRRPATSLPNQQALQTNGMAVYSGASEFQDLLQTYRICEDFADGSSRTELSAFLLSCVFAAALIRSVHLSHVCQAD